MSNNNNKKKSGGIAPIAWIVGIFLVFGLIDELPSSAVAVIVFTVIVIAVIVLIAKQAKKKRAEVYSNRPVSAAGSSEHSHDRLAGYVDNSCDGLRHWQQQLDGFLKAGIIDRNEYRVLLNKFRNSFPAGKY